MKYLHAAVYMYIIYNIIILCITKVLMGGVENRHESNPITMIIGWLLIWTVYA